MKSEQLCFLDSHRHGNMGAVVTITSKDKVQEFYKISLDGITNEVSLWVI